MIKIAICDDDSVILRHIYDKIKCITDELEKVFIIQTFLDGNKLLLQETKEISNFDIIFLDIDMPSINGFEVAEIIRRFNEKIKVIFLTSMEHLVYESFKYKPFRFVRKHRINEELCEVLHSAIAAVENSTGYQYNFKTEFGEVKLNILDILYIECLNRKVYLKTINKQYSLIGVQFSEMINSFLDKGFVLIHRSCIVNLKYIFSIGKLDIILDNGEKLPMSRYKVNEVKRAFTLYAE